MVLKENKLYTEHIENTGKYLERVSRKWEYKGGSNLNCE
jgi:hypothetical protein